MRSSLPWHAIVPSAAKVKTDQNGLTDYDFWAYKEELTLE
ncbi:hypothetical protein ATPR_0206 [Acetobacter tropicalis NBRC 101654]|uniref:Uncharacterized protein n=1 Tax=Acetobacter tropicalis NBRC 101654 TaxID=749388 RepID=F7VA07_9PROT|nr:hypothetical protein ATPR_0206 [Acetobacter tropicalis NBRC 101654]